MSDLQPSEVVQSWLGRARSDLLLGRAGLRTWNRKFPRGSTGRCLFSCPAKRRKSLERSGTHLGIPFPRTHVLETLLDLLKADGMVVPANVDEAFELTQYAVQTRYPGEWEPVGKTEARQALDRATLVLTWVENQINLHP